MLRTFLLTVSVLCAVVCVGLVYGWGFGVLDDRAWRQHSTAWLAWSLAAFVLSTHPLITAFDRRHRA